jgi:GT2 family glycosyltransferase
VKVLACVVSWNTASHLPASLASLAAQTHSDLEVVVVDNASRDDSAAVVRSHGVRLVQNRANLGYAGAANQAVALAREAGADAVVLANPDAVLAPDCLAEAVAAMDAEPRRASVQPKLWRAAPGSRARTTIDSTGHVAFATRLFRNRGEGQPDDGSWDTPGPVFGVSGALAVYRLAALDDVAVDGEVFDADLFAFFEDVDLDWRFALRGWDCWYAPAATGWHERGGAGPRRSAVVEELNWRNRLLVVVKNDDPRALAAALPGVTVTNVLKTAELALTVPVALVRGVRGVARLLPATLARRRRVQAAATVDPAAVAARWFGPFDYAGWVRTWYARVRGEARLPGGPRPAS